MRILVKRTVTVKLLIEAESPVQVGGSRPLVLIEGGFLIQPRSSIEARSPTQAGRPVVHLVPTYDTISEIIASAISNKLWCDAQ